MGKIAELIERNARRAFADDAEKDTACSQPDRGLPASANSASADPLRIRHFLTRI